MYVGIHTCIYVYIYIYTYMQWASVETEVAGGVMGGYYANKYTYESSWTVPVELQFDEVHCNQMQHTATHCNTLQHTATYSSRYDEGL